MGAFYGFIADGFYRDSVDAAQCGNGNAAGKCWDDGARPGRIKFRDLNGDGRINGDDKTIIGTPNRASRPGWDRCLCTARGTIVPPRSGPSGKRSLTWQKECTWSL